MFTCCKLVAIFFFQHYFNPKAQLVTTVVPCNSYKMLGIEFLALEMDISLASSVVPSH